MNLREKITLLRNPVYKTIAYYRRHGLGRTIRRVFTELRIRLTSRRKVEIYPPQSYRSADFRGQAR